jgi:signal transduction histidine kinase
VTASGGGAAEGGATGASPDAPARAPGPVAPLEAPAEPVEVLAVDDRPTNLKVLEALLEGVARVLSAPSGAEALRVLLDHDVAVILLDVQMPGMDGFETAELIRSRDRNRFTPILFVTAHVPTDEELRRGYAVGAADYLVKPVPPEILRAKAAVFVELHQMRRREERVRNELQRSNRDLARFAQGAAHDLQSPLRGIVDSLRGLERIASRLDEEARGTVAAALAETERMRRLVRTLLAYARVRTENPAPVTADATEILQDALLSLRSAIVASGAEVAREPLPRVRADPLLLRQVFQNLVENAIRYRGDRPPRVRVSSRRLGGQWEFAVRDEGIGIDPRDHEIVFEAFRRVAPRARGDEGTGLGLAICREIVARHGGRIWVESEAGRGATFRFTLPAAEE